MNKLYQIVYFSSFKQVIKYFISDIIVRDFLVILPLSVKLPSCNNHAFLLWNHRLSPVFCPSFVFHLYCSKVGFISGTSVSQEIDAAKRTKCVSSYSGVDREDSKIESIIIFSLIKGCLSWSIRMQGINMLQCGCVNTVTVLPRTLQHLLLHQFTAY